MKIAIWMALQTNLDYVKLLNLIKELVDRSFLVSFNYLV